MNAFLRRKPYYITPMGAAYLGDALDLLKDLRDNSVDLILTSPPFPLACQKNYGAGFDIDPRSYAEWFLPFAKEMYRVLKPDGSLVLHLGGAWVKGKPLKSLYSFELLLLLIKEIGFNLAQDFYWFNPLSFHLQLNGSVSKGRG